MPGQQISSAGRRSGREICDIADILSAVRVYESWRRLLRPDTPVPAVPRGVDESADCMRFPILSASTQSKQGFRGLFRRVGYWLCSLQHCGFAKERCRRRTDAPHLRLRQCDRDCVSDVRHRRSVHRISGFNSAQRQRQALYRPALRKFRRDPAIQGASSKSESVDLFGRVGRQRSGLLDRCWHRGCMYRVGDFVHRHVRKGQHCSRCSSSGSVRWLEYQLGVPDGGGQAELHCAAKRIPHATQCSDQDHG